MYLSDTTFITMNVVLDKSAAEIAALARAKIRRQRRHQQLHQLNSVHHHHSHPINNGVNGLAPPQHLSSHRQLAGVTSFREDDLSGNCPEVVGEEEEEENCFLIGSTQ